GLLMLFSWRSRLSGFILVFRRVEFEIEETGKIAAGVAPAASAARLAKGDLDLAERGFGSQERLKRLLLERNSVFPLHAFQFLRRRSHCRSRVLHVFVEFSELAVGLRDVAALHAH